MFSTHTLQVKFTEIGGKKNRNTGTELKIEGKGVGDDLLINITSPWGHSTVYLQFPSLHSFLSLYHPSLLHRGRNLLFFLTLCVYLRHFHALFAFSCTKGRSLWCCLPWFVLVHQLNHHLTSHFPERVTESFFRQSSDSFFPPIL